jgi:nitroreductase
VRAESSKRSNPIAKARLCAHIIDKGLHRPDFEPMHSMGLRQDLGHIIKMDGLHDDGTLTWVKTIIHDYDAAQVGGNIALEGYGSSFFRQHDCLTPEQYLLFLHLRRSCRNFMEGERVTEGQLYKIMEAALEAPTSCNRLAVKMYATLDPDKARAVLSCFPGYTCFGPYIPCAIVFCVDLSAYTIPLELFLPTIDSGLVISYGLLMATAQDLSITLLAAAILKSQEEARLRKLLGIPDHMSIVVGGACGKPKSLPRRPGRPRPEDAVVIS